MVYIGFIYNPIVRKTLLLCLIIKFFLTKQWIGLLYDLTTKIFTIFYCLFFVNRLEYDKMVNIVCLTFKNIILFEGVLL